MFKDGKAKEYLSYTDNEILQYMNLMQKVIEMPQLVKDLNLDTKDIDKRLSSIENAKKYRGKEGKDGKRVKDFDEKVLRYPLLCLINSLQNVRKKELVDIDMYVAEIYRATEYKYYNKDINDTIDKKDVLDQIGKERREIFKRHRNEFVFIPAYDIPKELK